MQLILLSLKVYFVGRLRIFLTVKSILDVATEAVELDVHSNKGMLVSPNIRLGANIALYNIRLEELNEKRKSWELSRLEKALKMLPLIDPDNLSPTPDSRNQLKDEILKDAKGDEWFRSKVLSLEYQDGFNFNKLLNE